MLRARASRTFLSSIISDISQGRLIRREGVFRKDQSHGIRVPIHARHARKQCSVSEMYGLDLVTLRDCF